MRLAGYLGRDVAAAAADPRAVERAAADIARIGAAADTMHDLLQDLLELSRVGRLINPPEAVPLSELAAEAAALVAGRIGERGAVIDVGPAMPVAFVDRRRSASAAPWRVDAVFLELLVEARARHAEALGGAPGRAGSSGPWGNVTEPGCRSSGPWGNVTERG